MIQLDWYTKSILTVIAVCLSYFALRDLTSTPKAYAYGKEPVDVNIVSINGSSFGVLDVSTYRPALPVKIMNAD